MDLQHIQLPASVIADLYPNVLSSPQLEAKIPDSKIQKPVYLGENKRQVLIGIKSELALFLPDAELQFLIKILEACKMNLADIALINFSKQSHNIENLRESLAPRVFILFGIEPAEVELPIDFPDFKLQSYAGCTFLKAPDMALLFEEKDASKPLKTKLWGCLKELFLS